MNRRMIARELLKLAKLLVANDQSEVTVKVLLNNNRDVEEEEAGSIKCSYNPDGNYSLDEIADDANQMTLILKELLGDWGFNIQYDYDGIDITVWDEGDPEEAKDAIVDFLKKHYTVQE